MLEDGLNDSGAIAQSEVGIALFENINIFSHACDGIMDTSVFRKLEQFLIASKRAINIVKRSFLSSLSQNSIQIQNTVKEQLKPSTTTIIMPHSSISIVVFKTITSNWAGRKLV